MSKLRNEPMPRDISRYFVRPTPRRYVTTQPHAVILAMREQGLW